MNDWQISFLVQSCNPHTRQDQRPLPAPPGKNISKMASLFVAKLNIFKLFSLLIPASNGFVFEYK